MSGTVISVVVVRGFSTTCLNFWTSVGGGTLWFAQTNITFWHLKQRPWIETWWYDLIWLWPRISVPWALPVPMQFSKEQFLAERFSIARTFLYHYWPRFKIMLITVLILGLPFWVSDYFNAFVMWPLWIFIFLHFLFRLQKKTTLTLN